MRRALQTCFITFCGDLLGSILVFIRLGGANRQTDRWCLHPCFLFIVIPRESRVGVRGSVGKPSLVPIRRLEFPMCSNRFEASAILYFGSLANRYLIFSFLLSTTECAAGRVLIRFFKNSEISSKSIDRSIDRSINICDGSSSLPRLHIFLQLSLFSLSETKSKPRRNFQ